MTLDHYTNVLKFWRSVETFNLPDLPSALRGRARTFFKELVPQTPLPWEPGELNTIEGDRQWKHTLYFYVVQKEAVVDLLAQLSLSKDFREPVGGLTFLSALVLDHQGHPVDRSYTPAAFIYGIKILKEKIDPEELPGLLKKAQEESMVRFQGDKKQSSGNDLMEPKILDWPALEKELHLLKGMTRHGLAPQIPVLCVSEPVMAGASNEAPFLNSYYVHDLNSLIGDIKHIGRPMEIYLTRDAAIHSRRDLLTPRILLEALHPKHQSPGRWPSDPAFGLYSAQQAALHAAMPDLRLHSSLVGINGPPGTGKTTLLREVIADVVVARARRLLNAKVSEIFSRKRDTVVDLMGYYKFDAAVFGNDGIVVSSNNNAAIENISKELPLLNSIDPIAFNDADYFSSAASHIYEESCWGMLSAVLGRSGNRSAFVNKFWFSNKSNGNEGGEKNGFGSFLKLQYTDPALREDNAAKYEETATELRQLLDEYAVFNDLAGEYHDLLLEGKGAHRRLGELASRLRSDYDLSGDGLPSSRFLELSWNNIHRLTPYSSVKINTLRSRIFLLSLKLHEYAIRVNARQFNSNLSAWVNMVSNKHGSFITEEMAAVLWNSFFFCIPVVSVTLASFQRQFPKMGQGSIGWLLLDEAGQATPASACGAIWRSERCIIIGDTLQIPPVVTIPAALGKLLQHAYGVEEDCWNPVYHSAQFLADRVTTTGTYIDLGGDDPTWTGIPLRAHRRCGEPMFSIANTIAYNGQMVKVTQDVVSKIPTGPSRWIDVKGFVPLDGHAIAEEIQALHDGLLQLRYYTGVVYIISPFQTVANICRERFYERGRIECGTIHAFQGKEAEIVFLVLGKLPGSERARDWVAQSPNMLNVAVTRAKQRLYVIGNRDVWARHRYFSYLAERLPQSGSGMLF